MASCLARLTVVSLLCSAQLSCARDDVNAETEHKVTSKLDDWLPRARRDSPGKSSMAPQEYVEEPRLSTSNEPPKWRPRVFGGNLARTGDFKAIVFISTTHNYMMSGMGFYGGRSNCTGALISPQWVITASHCMPSRYLYMHFNKLGDTSITSVDVKISVTAGNHDLFDKTAETAVTLKPKKPPVFQEDIVIHENAVTFATNDPEDPTFVYDVVLLKMRSSFPQNHVIGTFPLMTGAMPEMFPDKCFALGYGKQFEKNENGHVVVDGKLYFVLVTAGGSAFCQNITKLDKWTDDQFVCTHNLDDKKLMTCMGDSGSPLLCGRKGDPTIVGVLSGSTKGGRCGKSTLDDDYTFTGLIEAWVSEKTDNAAVFRTLTSTDARSARTKQSACARHGPARFNSLAITLSLLYAAL